MKIGDVVIIKRWCWGFGPGTLGVIDSVSNYQKGYHQLFRIKTEEFPWASMVCSTRNLINLGPL